MKQWKRAAAVLLSVCALGFCAACDKGSSESEGDGHEHAWTNTTVKGETCTEKGLDLKSCMYCGEMEYVETPAKHSLEKVDEEFPTCTEKGFVYWICQNCDYEQTDEIAETGHNYVDGVCVHEGCGKLEKA